MVISKVEELLRKAEFNYHFVCKDNPEKVVYYKEVHGITEYFVFMIKYNEYILWDMYLTADNEIRNPDRLKALIDIAWEDLLKARKSLMEADTRVVKNNDSYTDFNVGVKK